MAKLRFIPEARQAWRMLSVQVGIAAVAFGAMPPDQQTAVLALFGLGPERAPLVVGVALILARLIYQPKLRAADQAPPQ